MNETYPVECPNCCTTHRVERDEDGASLETFRCQGSDACEVLMCSECLQQCCSCDLPTCEAHLGQSPKYSGEKWCHICLAGGPEFEAASQSNAALVTAMAERALEDAALFAGAKLTEPEARALIAQGMVD